MTYLLLLRIFFSSYTRRINGGSKPDTTAELAAAGKFLTKQKRQPLKAAPYQTTANHAFLSALTLEVLEQAKDRTWLAKVTNALNQHWRKKNANKRSKLENGCDLKRLTLNSD